MRFRGFVLAAGIAAFSATAGIEGLRRFGLWLRGNELAGAPSPLLTVLGASATLALGAWLCVVLVRHSRAGLTLILAWSVAAVLATAMGHLNHAAIRTPCRGQVAAQAPLGRRCSELQQRGRL